MNTEKPDDRPTMYTDRLAELRAERDTLAAQLAEIEAKRISRDTSEGCCRAAVDSDGHAHDHVEWYCDLVEAEAQLERARRLIAAAIAWRGTDDGHPGWVMPPSIGQVKELIDSVDAYQSSPSEPETSRTDDLASVQVKPDTDSGTPAEILLREIFEPMLHGASGTHIGRSWGSGRDLEDDCPCPKEPCGLVDSGRAVAECTQHPVTRAKTIRQSHNVEDCPGRPADA